MLSRQCVKARPSCVVRSRICKRCPKPRWTCGRSSRIHRCSARPLLQRASVLPFDCSAIRLIPTPDMTETLYGKPLSTWRAEFPLLEPLMQHRPVAWFNPAIAPLADALVDISLDAADVRDA